MVAVRRVGGALVVAVHLHPVRSVGGVGRRGAARVGGRRAALWGRAVPVGGESRGVRRLLLLIGWC